MAPSGVELNKVSALRNLLSLLTGKFPMGSLGGKKRERNEIYGPLKNHHGTIERPSIDPHEAIHGPFIDHL